MSVRSGNMQNVFPESSPSSKAKGRKSKAAEDPRDLAAPTTIVVKARTQKTSNSEGPWALSNRSSGGCLLLCRSKRMKHKGADRWPLARRELVPHVDVVMWWNLSN
jgi:hypothetical protein